MMNYQRENNRRILSMSCVDDDSNVFKEQENNNRMWVEGKKNWKRFLADNRDINNGF